MPETDPETREKWRAYPNSVLTFDEPHAVRIDLRQRLPDEARSDLAAGGWANPFAVLTAENPSGDHAEDEATQSKEAATEHANARRRGRLLDELRRRRIRSRPVTSSSADGSYSERCVAIDATLEESTGLARDWDQLAFFWFDGASFWLVPAKVGEPPLALPGAPAGS